MAIPRRAAMAMLLGGLACSVNAQAQRDASRVDLQAIQERRALTTGNSFTRDFPDDLRPQRGSAPRERPLIDPRQLMPAFPDERPSTPLVQPQDPGAADGRANLATIKDDCKQAVGDVIGNIRSAERRDRWYRACTATDLPAGFELVRQAAGGLMETGSTTIFCSGVLLDSRTFLTAKHCFFDERTGQARREWALLRAGRIQVRSDLGDFIVGCGTGEYVPCVPRLRSGFGLSTDRLFLTVASGPADFKGMPFGPVKVGDELLLYSHFDTGGTRRYSKPGCQVQAISGQCVVHGCQADHASSGGALFFRDGDQLKVAGIHLSGATISTDCGFNTAVTSNIGLLLPR